MEDLSGRQFGAYKIIAPLGEGGMAAVYQAYQPSVDRTVALKVLPQRLASDAQFQARFQLEARVVASLQHPHILSVFDYGESDGYTYFVMPYVAGGTLSRRLTGTPVPLLRVLDIMRQVCDALEYAHSKGVIHRDIKPSNILIDERNNCLVADFGLAKLLESNSHLTTTRGMMGTPAYMAPEQAMGDVVTPRCDIYSLSIVLYEMLTGRVPYKAETPLAVAIKHTEGRVPSPRTFNAALPAALEEVMLRGLARDPDERYSTCLDLYHALEAASRVFADESMRKETDSYPATPREDPRESPALPAQSDVTLPVPHDSVSEAPAAPPPAPVAALGDMPLYQEAAAPASSHRDVVRPRAHRLRNGALATAATVALAAGLWWSLRPGPAVPTTLVSSTSAPTVPATSTPPAVTPTSAAPVAAVARPADTPPPAPSTSLPASQPQAIARPAAITSSASLTTSSAIAMPVSAPPPVSVSPPVSAPPTVSAPRVVIAVPTPPPSASSTTSAAAAASATQTVPSTGGASSPRKTKTVPPVYPQEAVDANVEGTVTLEAQVNAAGKVVDAKVLKSIPLLDAAAIAAVKQWEYEPTMTQVAGEPVAIPVTLIVSVTFKIK